MRTYRVTVETVISYEVEVFTDHPDKAKVIALEKMEEGEGVEVDSSGFRVAQAGVREIK